MTKQRLANHRTASMPNIVADLIPATLIVSLFVVVGVIHVTSRTLVVKAGYAFSLAAQEGEKLERESRRLKLELATLRSPRRLEALARSEFGMGPISASAVFTPQESRPKPVLEKLAKRDGP